MTNGEKYKNEIEKVDYNFGVDYNENIIPCEYKSCCNCIFYKDDIIGCVGALVKWLCSEYKEPTKLTDSDKELLRRLYSGGYRWIARNKVGDVLTAFKDEPYKESEISLVCWDSFDDPVIIPKCLDNFSFIKWEDDEPCNIEKLLNEQ